MVHLTPFFVNLKKRFYADKKPLFTSCYGRRIRDEFFLQYSFKKANFQSMRCLDCTFIILLLADLDSMSLGYHFFGRSQ